jgi:predicted nucleic acid-binding protein
MRELMRRYHDLPMDLADASLVAAAETLNLGQVFTLDRHFHAYRRFDTDPFTVLPG